MLTDERTLKPGLFPLPDVRVARNILIPGFRAATTVRGAFGWFTAGWIQQLAPGLAIHLTRDDTEPMQFTVAPALFPPERGAVERGAQMTEEEAATLVADVFIEGRAAAGPLARHALDCLSWMIATDALRLRIAVPTPESNYHPKLWLFDDGENQVLARGSGNATGKGVAVGVEHLDVDVSWQRDSRVPAGITMLNNWSAGHSPGITRVFDLPEAVAPKHHPDRPRTRATPERIRCSRHPGPDGVPTGSASPAAPTPSTRPPGVAHRSLRASGRCGRGLGARQPSRERGSRDGNGRRQNPYGVGLR